MLTGRPAFRGKNDPETLVQVLGTDPVPVRDYISAHGGLPAPTNMMWVSGGALRGLLKPCERRYADETMAGRLPAAQVAPLAGRPRKLLPPWYAPRCPMPMCSTTASQFVARIMMERV